MKHNKKWIHIRLYLIVTLLVSNLGQLTAVGQTSERSVGLFWGIGHVKRQDLNFSSMIHSKASPLALGVMYERIKHWNQKALVRYRHYAPKIGDHFSYFSTFYTHEYQTLPHVFDMLDFEYALGRELTDEGPISLTIGTKSKNRLWVASYDFGYAGSFGYYFSFGLDLWLQLTYPLGDRGRLITNLGLPVFSYRSRNPYMSQDDWYFEDSLPQGFGAFMNYIQRGELISWGTYRGLDLDISYIYMLNDKWDLGTTYWFSIQRDSNPAQFSQMEHMLTVSGKFKF